MRNSLIAACAWFLLAFIFVFDANTPQGVVLAILLNIPLVLAALTRNRSLVLGMTMVAVACDGCAAYIDLPASGNWETAIGANRLLAAFSILLVGCMNAELLKRSQRIGLITAREERMRREVALASSLERLRLLFSRDGIEQGLLREAILLFGIDGALWIPASSEKSMFKLEASSTEFVEERRPRDPEIASFLENVVAGKKPCDIVRSDTLGRFVTERFPCVGMTAFPVLEGENAHGILLLCSRSAKTLDEDEMLTACIFSRSLGTVLGRAELFSALARRNVEIDERNAVISDLVYALTHDLRTPLLALAMTMRQAHQGAFGTLPERYARTLQASLAAIEDLQRLSETLLTVARIENGELHTAHEPVELRRIMDEVVAECTALARSRNVALGSDATESATILADPGDIRRAVTNLVANALEHTPAGGRVHVELHNDTSTVVMRVLDDGYGISREFKPFLFERFSSKNRFNGHGTGLGLYIVRRITEAAAGRISHENRNPRGSIFTLSFPSAS